MFKSTEHNYTAAEIWSLINANEHIIDIYETDEILYPKTLYMKIIIYLQDIFRII
jgi:hypothetical protein